MFALIVAALVVAVAIAVLDRVLTDRPKRIMRILVGVLAWGALAGIAIRAGNAAFICAAVLLLICRLLAWHSDWPTPTSPGSWLRSV